MKGISNSIKQRSDGAERRANVALEWDRPPLTLSPLASEPTPVLVQFYCECGAVCGAPNSFDRPSSRTGLGQSQ